MDKINLIPKGITITPSKLIEKAKSELGISKHANLISEKFTE